MAPARRWANGTEGAVPRAARVPARLRIAGSRACSTGPGALRECFGEEISPEEREMDCVKFGDGEWHPAGGSRGPESLFGTFVIFALLLSLVPAFVGVAVSKDAGVTPLVGGAIGLFGSWIGVIILYVSGQSRKASSSVISIGSSRPPETAPDAGSGQPAERLRTLKDLLDSGPDNARGVRSAPGRDRREPLGSASPRLVPRVDPPGAGVRNPIDARRRPLDSCGETTGGLTRWKLLRNRKLVAPGHLGYRFSSASRSSPTSPRTQATRRHQRCSAFWHV